MVDEDCVLHSFVVKPDDLWVLNYLRPSHPTPTSLDWINRGTDKKLKPSSIDVLLRTIFLQVASPSVVKLHRDAGLRINFGSECDRLRFRSRFEEAKKKYGHRSEHTISAIFQDLEHARRAVEGLKNDGMPESSIAMLWRASLFVNEHTTWHEEASKLSIASAIAGAGLAGTLFAVGLVVVPGIGPVIAAGALAQATLPAIATLGSVVGATGGAIARMLSDHDVDGVASAFYEQQIRDGKIFVSVDTSNLLVNPWDIRQLLVHSGGILSTKV